MKIEDKVEVVQRMQDYIKDNIKKSGFCLDDVYQSAGYSKRHADRLFSELVHMTPAEYIRKIVLSLSSEKLISSDANVIDIALDSNYESHEGYTRAFKKNFNIAPEEYRNKPRAIPLFTPYPVWAYYAHQNHQDNFHSEKNSMKCTVTAVERRPRKLVLLRSKKASDYWSFCEEMGCDWEGLLNSIPEKMDIAAMLELPESMVKKDTSNIAVGVEIPLNYQIQVPDCYEIIELNSCIMLYFESECFEDDKMYQAAMDCVYQAFQNYSPEDHGFRYNFDSVPSFNFGATPLRGARLAVPARKV